MKQILFICAVVALVGCGKNKKEDLITTWTSDPSNPQNVIVEAAIREELKKPTGELTKADLKKVTKLRLSNTEITDAGLKEIAKMKQLTILFLYRTKITDAGLKEIAKLQKLELLNLNDTNITDAGLKAVAKLQNLIELSLGNTKNTAAGVAELKKALPKCRIYSNPTK